MKVYFYTFILFLVIYYLYDNAQIQDSIIQEVEENSSFTLVAPIIEGYEIQYCVIDGEKQETSDVHISDVGSENHLIEFVYDVSLKPSIMRIIVNGLYTKDDGSLANGYHQYKKINIDSISESEGIFAITCDNINWVHEDNGKPLSIKVGTKLVLIPGNIFVQVDEIVDVENNKVTFKATEFTPTEAEKNSYVTGWYD